MNFNNIPLEMQQMKAWTCFRSYLDNETQKQNKVIISPVNGKFAKCNDPETWTDFESAKKYCIKNKYLGLTFALTSGITFIDIDHAIDKESGEILSEEAKQLMLLFPDTYIEKSVSGTGIHIILKGSLPDKALNRNDKKGLEMYDRNRFMCMTGNLLSDTISLKDCAETIGQINRDFIGIRPEPIVFKPAINDWSPSDNELLQKIRSSKICDRFDELNSGGFGNCADHSSADFALCSLLAFWTQDVSQIDRIFRCSGLYRDKWDGSRGAMTYGSLTIERALQAVSRRYTPYVKPKWSTRAPIEM